MIEPPSSQLVQTLLGLKLCSATDIRRCRRRVKRLARDLPAFDTIWIDALLQARRLTPFQAGLLDSSNPQQICVGPCVLVDRLGGRSGAHTFLARQRVGNERCVLKLIESPADSSAAPLARLEELVERTRPVAHPSIVPPRTALSIGEQIALVSRYVPGANLAQLLVRRGRFPANIVAELAAQLIDGLAAAEPCGLVHGDIRLANVRLTSQGVAVLVDFGVRAAVEPELSIHSTMTPEYCDGIAPELIGTGNAPSAASDLYALGCLLWQLLAGRPPFMTADPLAKLACHQTRRIADVRDIAPDVPAQLAESIRVFTSPDPSERPQSFREVRQQSKLPRRSGRNRVAEFSALFNSAAPRVPIAAREPSSSKWPLLVVLLFVLSGATLTLVDKGATSLPLAVRDMTLRLIERNRGDGSDTPADATKNENRPATPNDLLSLPAPDAEGVIELSSDGPYACSRIDTVGSLTIRGAPKRRPVVIVQDAPLFLIASLKVTVQNVHFRWRESSPNLRPAAASNKRTKGRTVPLLKVRTQTFVAENCSFVTEAEASSNVSKSAASTLRPPPMIDWEPVNANDQTSRQVSLQNAAFIGGAPAVELDSAPQVLHAVNCLKVGRGPFLVLAHAPKAHERFQTNLKQVTLRDADGLYDVRVAGNSTPLGLIAVESTDSVFHFGNDGSSLLQFVGDQEIKAANVRVDVGGEGTVANRSFNVAAWTGTAKQAGTSLNSDTIVLDGVLAVPFEFAGPADRNPRNSAVRAVPTQGPRRSSLPPGIDASLLNVPADAETASVH
ncbi:MAG: serine/threonine-protein kinase [Planctomycetaceae bacterium]